MDAELIEELEARVGDTIKMHDKQLFINDQVLSTTESTTPTKHDNEQVIQIEKTRKGKMRYQTQWSLSDTSTIDSLTVPQNSVFVMGDNRSTSEDSREFGAIPLEDVMGKARQVWFSWDKKCKTI